MNRTSANFLLIVGFLMTLGGVGGVEQSLDNPTLITALVVSILGLAIVWCGITAHKINGDM